MNDQEILDHGIHLLIDNELDPKLREQVLERVQKNPILAKAYQEIKNCKDSVAFSYNQEELVPMHVVSNQQPNSMYTRFAASITLAIGLSVGWFANDMSQQTIEAQAETVALNQTSHVEKAVPASLNQDNTRKYMFHINTDNLVKVNNTLTETKAILNSYADSEIPIRVEILVDQEGIKLFGPKYVSELKAIKTLVNSYENISFFACSESMHTFGEDKPIKNNYPEIDTGHVVKDIIPQRIKDGWIYIQA